MRIQCALNSICFGCASDAHHNKLHVKAPLVVVLLDALTGTAKRLDLDSFVFLSNLTVEGRNGFLLQEEKMGSQENIREFAASTSCQVGIRLLKTTSFLHISFL